jgi:hypothetical protein
MKRKKKDATVEEYRPKQKDAHMESINKKENRE